LNYGNNLGGAEHVMLEQNCVENNSPLIYADVVSRIDADKKKKEIYYFLFFTQR